MEISVVRQRVLQTIDRARAAAAERRTRVDQASREYALFLDRIAVPLFKQVENVLRAHNYAFDVFTPSGSVRLMSERSSEDYIELVLDTTGDVPVVMGRWSRMRGSRGVAGERALNPSTSIGELTEDDVLAFVMKELEPFVEK
jgi:hypothetical protein